ncbi:MAG: hypothetical protein V2A76_10845 [Planctomycetota bacterium]
MFKEKRKKRLIEPRLQLTFALTFLATATTGILVSSCITCYLLDKLASNLPNDGEVVRGLTSGALTQSALLTSLLLVPACLIIGTAVTFRIVGPLHRFRHFLREVADGKRPEQCRLRKKDELQDFCDLLNRVTEPLREPEQPEQDDSDQRIVRIEKTYEEVALTTSHTLEK